MTPEEFNNIIEKYLEGKATPSELTILKNFELYTENKLKNEVSRNEYEKSALKKKLFQKIKKKNNTKKVNYLIYVAASVLLLISFKLLYQPNNKDTFVELNSTAFNIQPGTNKAILTLEDGSIIKLKKDSIVQTKNASSDGIQLVYNTKKEQTGKIAYNYLTIPRGGEFHILLADGTEVWLNSETQLKYPVNFVKGKTRVVELVYGEAYFKVSPSTAHYGAKFKVYNQSQEVEVLGTQFNIKAYKDEMKIYTTLVEGKVSIKSGHHHHTLTPNKQSILDLKNKKITVNTIDVTTETSWIHGDFIFQHKPLKEISKVLSRWYDIEIGIQNKKIGEAKFNGDLSKYQDLDSILLLIKNTNFINNYEKIDKKVILK